MRVETDISELLIPLIIWQVKELEKVFVITGASLWIQRSLLTPWWERCFHGKGVSSSMTEMPYWWHKICPESGQELSLVKVLFLFFLLLFHELQTKHKRSQRSNVNVTNLLQIINNYFWNINYIYGSSEEAFEFCWGSFAEEHKT